MAHGITARLNMLVVPWVQFADATGLGCCPEMLLEASGEIGAAAAAGGLLTTGDTGATSSLIFSGRPYVILPTPLETSLPD